MPIISEESRQFKRFIPTQQTDNSQIESESPGTVEVVRAAFEQENTLANFAANGFGLGDEFKPIKDYNPYDNDVRGYEMYADSFIDSRSPEQTNAIKTQIDEEERRRDLLSNGGATAVVSTIAAGLTDPIYWPLMAVGVGQARVVASTGQAFAKAAAFSAISEVPAEIVKGELQETRTLEESAFNVGGAAILGGLLGVGVNKLAGAAPEAGVDASSLTREIEQNFNSPEANLSMGAAQTRMMTKEEMDLVGVGGLEKLPVSPMLRGMNSPELATRDIMASLLETPMVVKGNIEGKTVVPEGGSVETRIKRWDANLYEGLSNLKSHHKAYKQKNKGQSLSYRDFRIEVSKASRRGDKHSIPEVAQAAQDMRRDLFDPLKDAAIEGKLLPHDVTVTTADSYLTRVYNFDKIVARRPEWDKIVDDWLGGLRSAAKVEIDARVAQGKEPPQSLKAEADVSDLEIQAIRNQITDKIMGVSSGRLPYDLPITEVGPLKERTFQIRDDLIEDFLESDMEIIARQYQRTMGPDVELNRMYGEVDMASEIERINQGYAKQRSAAKTEKERDNINNRRKSDVRDVEAVRDRLRGTYGAPADPNAFFVKASRTIRDVNFMSLLGGMTLSAIPDAARLVAVNGLKPVSKGLVNLAKSPKQFGLARSEARKAAVGLDMVLNSRASSLAEITDAYQRGSATQRGLRAASDAFSKLTLMSQWNASMKQFAGVITNDRIVSEAVKWSSGAISKSSRTRMAVSGIDEGLARRIAKQFDKYGDDGEIKIINGDSWDDLEALEALKSAVLKDVDRTIVTPGVGEKPLWTSGEMGKTIFQFKTFAASAHHKVFLADLQYRDASALNGFLLATALGSLSYGLKQYTAGREISRNPNQLVVESLDRSGAFGYFWDVNNITAKMTNGEWSVQKAFGADPVSRYASRNIMGALFGPTVGKIEDVRATTGNLASEGELSESDIRRIRRFLPGQNLFYMRRILDGLEREIAN